MKRTDKLTLARNYIKTVLNSDEFKNGLNLEEKNKVRQFFKIGLKKIISEANRKGFDAAHALLESEQKQHAQDRKKKRAERGVVINALSDLIAGSAGLVPSAANVTAWLAQMVGADETAQSLAQFAKDKQYDIEQALPPAEWNESAPDGWLPSLDFVGSTALRNLPPMLTTGAASKALVGGGSALMGGSLSRGASKALEIAGTGVGMSLPETYGDSVSQDAFGNVQLPKHPGVAGLMALPHAAVEVGLGISPAKLTDLGTKKFITKNFVQKMKRYIRRYGPGNAAKYVTKQLFGAGFGEGSEEVAQGVIGIFNRNLSNKEPGQALSDSVDELMKPETLKGLYQEFVGGATTGLIYDAGRSIARRIPRKASEKVVDGDIEGATNEIDTAINSNETSIPEKQELAKQKQVLQLPYVITSATSQALKDSDFNQARSIHPFEILGYPNPYETVGTMEDYQRYQREKQGTPEAESDQGEAISYPEGRIGEELKALDLAEAQPESLQVAEGSYETPMLPFNGSVLPGGEVVKDSPTKDFIGLKSGKPFANEKTAKAFQTKNNMQETHDITPVRGGFVLMEKPAQQSPMRISAETPRPSGSVEIVEQRPIKRQGTMSLTKTGDASRIEKKLTQKDAFRQTGVNSQLVTIEKPARAEKPLYSVEYLVAGYTAKGLKKAGSIVKRGFELIRSGVSKFAKWARQMFNEFGQDVKKHLRSLWKELQTANKKLGKRGAIQLPSGKKPLRDSNVPASDKVFELLGVPKDRIYADYNFLFNRHTEYFEDPGRVRDVVEDVLANPEFATNEADGLAGLVKTGVGGKEHKHPKVKIRLAKRPNGYYIRSVHLFNDRQLEENRRSRQQSVDRITSDNLIPGFTNKRYPQDVLTSTSSTKNDTPSGQNVNQITKGNEPGLIKMSDLEWIKDHKDQMRLEFIDKSTGEVKTVATLVRNAKKKWEWQNTNRAFLTASSARNFVKSYLFEKMKREERKSRKYKRIEKNRLAQEAQKEQTAKARAESKTHRHDDYFNQETTKRKIEPEKPKTWKDKAAVFMDRATSVLFDKWHSLKKVQDKALKAKGLNSLPDEQNAYQRLEVMTGRIKERTANFKEKYWQPILDHLNEHKITYDQFNKFLRIMHAEERNRHIDNINPELRARGIPGSGISTQDAQAAIEQYKKDGVFDTYLEAGKMYWKLNNILLDKQVKYGLLSQETRDSFADAYKYYTPLKSPPDQGRNLDKRALGRRSESSDQLTYTMQAINTTFSRGEINRKNMAFLRFALSNPNDALYTIHTAKKKAFFNKMTGEVEYRYDRFSKWDDEVLHAKFNGQDIAIRIHDFELLNAVKNRGDLESGFLVRQLRSINRILSAVNTAWNPEFMLANLARDFQTAVVNASADESAKFSKSVFRNIGRAIRAGIDAKRGKSTSDVKLLKEFELQGGKIGYSEFYKLEELAYNLEAEMNERLANGTLYKTKQLLKKFTNLIENANEVIESGSRFAGYLAAKEAGMSKQQAAALAKNLTVNFNKKGTAGQLINTLYLFGNASLQGSARVLGVLKKASKTDKGRAMLASAIGFGFVMDLMNRMFAGIDDDEGINYYDKLLPSEKDNNFILMIPGKKGKYVKFPMPHGFNVLPALGRNVSAMMFGDQGFKDTVGNILGTGFGAFNPMGNDERGLFWNFTPTAVKPALDIATNSKWTGRKIRPDQPMFGAKQPQSQLYFEQTSKHLTAFTHWLNEVTGGNEYESGLIDVSPADTQYLLETVAGGMGKTFLRSFDSIRRGISNDDEVQIKNVPFLRRLSGKASDISTYDRFRENFDKIKVFEQARRERNVSWLKENKWLAYARGLAKRAEKQIRAVKQHRSLSKIKKKERILLIQKQFNKRFKEMEQKKAEQKKDTSVDTLPISSSH